MNKQQLARFKEDFIATASGEAAGIMEPWYYSDHKRKETISGNLAWGFFMQHDKYYILREEQTLIQSSVKTLERQGDLRFFDTVPDFGTGTEQAVLQKALPLIKACKNAKIYAPVDLSQAFLEAAKKTMNTHMPHIDVQAYQKNFFEDQFKLPGKKRIAGFFGSTISNIPMFKNADFPKSTMIKRLKHLATLVGKDNQILMAFDANPDLHAAKAAYDHEMWRILVLGPLYDAKQFINMEGYFRPQDWQHEFIINENAHTIQQWVTPNKKQEFAINGLEFFVDKGEGWLMSNNTKPPFTEMNSITDEAETPIINLFQSRTGRATCARVLAI